MKNIVEYIPMSLVSVSSLIVLYECICCKFILKTYRSWYFKPEALQKKYYKSCLIQTSPERGPPILRLNCCVTRVRVEEGRWGHQGSTSRRLFDPLTTTPPPPTPSLKQPKTDFLNTQTEDKPHHPSRSRRIFDPLPSNHPPPFPTPGWA